MTLHMYPEYYQQRFRVKFWGVRSGIPITRPDTYQFGGNTTCIEINCGNHLIILEAGTGIRLLGNSIQDSMPTTSHILFTKIDFERICGLPFFSPIYDCSNKFNVITASPHMRKEPREQVSKLLSHPHFPVPIDVMHGLDSFMSITDFQDQITIKNIKISNFDSELKNQAIGYKICFNEKVITYIVKLNDFNEQTIEAVNKFTVNSNLLILSSSNNILISDALDFIDSAKKYNAELIIHCGHQPTTNDGILDTIQNCFSENSNDLIAYEGLEINL